MTKYELMITNRDEWMQIARESDDKDATAIAVRHAREWNRQAVMRCRTRYGFPLEVKT